jgi:hypothetical protein
MRPRLIRRWLIAILILLAVIGLIVGTLWATNALGWRRWRIQEAQAFIGANLPAAATNVQFSTQDDHTRILWLRFEIPVDMDLESWLTSIAGDNTLLENFTPFPQPNPQEAGITWWTPPTATAFSGLHRVTSTQMIEVLVDQSDPTSKVVYLRVYNLA